MSSATVHKSISEIPHTVFNLSWYCREHIFELPHEVFNRGNWHIKYAHSTNDPTKVFIEIGNGKNAPPKDNTGSYEWLHSLAYQLSWNAFESPAIHNTEKYGTYTSWQSSMYKQFEKDHWNSIIFDCDPLSTKSKYELLQDQYALDKIKLLFKCPSHPLQMDFLNKFCNVSYPSGSILSTGINYYSPLMPRGGIPGYHLLIGYKYITLYNEYSDYNFGYNKIVDINDFVYWKLCDESIELEVTYLNDIEYGLPSVLQLKSHFKAKDLYDHDDIYVQVLYPSMKNFKPMDMNVMVYIGKMPWATKFIARTDEQLTEHYTKSIDVYRNMNTRVDMIRPAKNKEIVKYLQ